MRRVALIWILLSAVVLSSGCASETSQVQTTDSPQTTIVPETPAPHLPETSRPTQPPTTKTNSIPTTTSTSTTSTSQTTTTTTTTSTSSTTTTIQTQVKKYDLDVVYKTDKTPQPSWLIDNFQESAPWEGSIYMATSRDGLKFEGEKLFVDRAGVPNLLLTTDGRLIATFQYFSFVNEEMFDVIAYTISDDLGKTWTPVNKIQFQGKGFDPEKIGPGSPNPVDPTLLELEDRSLRLYFTFHPPGIMYPQLFSAHADSLDTPFEAEGPQLETDKMILDPAVVYYNGLWHHYTVRHGEKQGNKHINVHSTSSDGQNFEMQDDILLEFQLLGQVIEDMGKLSFYGSGNGVQSATSTDGFEWNMDQGSRVDGADPGIVKLPDGSYLLIYTKLQPK